jgi:signal transduction histidine kinase
MITAVVVYAALTALISALLVERSRRQRAEHAHRASEAALRSSGTDARHLASRLIATQESERYRLARDLHDNLGQKLALLCIDLQRLGTSPSLPPAEIAASVAQLLERATDIAGDVHCLSHDLHPPKLDLLGLAPAIEALCRDVSRQYDIRIEFRQRGVRRRVSPEAALCLFRIAQEALQNVVKHSGGSAASVRLVGTARSICLHVADGGKGFDLASYSGAGLGLLSIRERAHLAGGRVGIRTAIDRGTRIVVTLPVTWEPPCPSPGTHRERGTSHLSREAAAVHVAPWQEPGFPTAQFSESRGE